MQFRLLLLLDTFDLTVNYFFPQVLLLKLVQPILKCFVGSTKGLLFACLTYEYYRLFIYLIKCLDIIILTFPEINCHSFMFYIFLKNYRIIINFFKNLLFISNLQIRNGIIVHLS